MTIQTDLSEGIFTITIDNPDRMNSFGPKASMTLTESWQRARDDDEIRAVIFTAVGDRAFCTGMDLSEAGDLDAMTEAPAIGPYENDMWKPVVVAVNGVCAGAGLHFVAEGDIVLAASHATFVDPHVSVGQVAGLEPMLLSRRMPFGALSRMTLMGRAERIDAETAVRLGLASEVVPAEALQERAREIAGKLKGNSLAAMMGSKKALWMSLERPLSEGMSEAWKLITAHWDHPDATEGPRAFVEKRPPKWQ